MLPGQKSWRDYGLRNLRDVPDDERLPAPDLLPRSPSVDAALAAIAAEFGVSQQSPVRWITTPLETVPIQYDLLRHLVEDRNNAREQYARFVIPTLERPGEVYLTQYDDGTLRRRYVGLFRGPKQLLVIVRVNSDGSALYNIMDASDAKANRWRVGDLLWPKP